MKYILVVFVLATIAFSCSESINIDSVLKDVILAEETELQIERENYYASTGDWELYIFKNDSILLIEKDLRKSVGVHVWITQSLGYLKNSNKYSHEIILGASIFCGLQKSSYPYIESDTIPILVDSSLLTHDWQLTYEDTTINVTNMPFLYQRQSQSRIFLTFTPNITTGYKPFTISEIGKRSSVGISKTGHPNQNFYLNKTEGKYELIIEKIKYQKGNYYNKLENDTLTRIVELNILN